MPENKTKPTAASVDDYLAAIEDITRRSDCAALVEMMSNITKQAPIMWGDSIVGFGSYHSNATAFFMSPCSAIHCALRPTTIMPQNTIQPDQSSRLRHLFQRNQYLQSKLDKSTPLHLPVSASHPHPASQYV